MTNAAAIGYMIKAARSLGLSTEQIRALHDLMLAKMDWYTEEEAEAEYNKF